MLRAALLLGLLAQDPQAAFEKALAELKAGRADTALAGLQAVTEAKGDLRITGEHFRILAPVGGHPAVIAIVKRHGTGEALVVALREATPGERPALLRLAPMLADPLPALPAILSAGDDAAPALRAISWRGRTLGPAELDALLAASTGTGPLARAAKSALSELEDRLAPASGPGQSDPRRIRVFYGTDRAVRSPAAGEAAIRFLPGALMLVVAFGVVPALIWVLHPRFARFERPLRWIGLALGVILAVIAAYGAVRDAYRMARLKVDYGPDRGPFHDSKTYAHFGTCLVGIPPRHQAGQVERPSLLSAHPWEDPQEHVMILRIFPQDRDEFFGDVAQAGRERAFVFVHGFNVSFEDAALRTAQIAHDLEFDGAPIFFSWPSRASVFEYTVDEATVTWATHHLKLFLRDVRRTLPAATIHLIAHSMGNRALTEALRSLSIELGRELPRFQEVILAAPDIDAATFRDDIVPALRPTGERITLYCAPYDEALAASRRVHGFPRAGDSSQGVFVAEGLETIDVAVQDPDILGHSYFGSVEPVLEDIVSLILHRKRPAERGLTPVGRFWRLGR